MSKTYKYLRFEELEPKPKTKQFAVMSKLSSTFVLGYVRWYAQWRRYCFFVNHADLVFDADCLADIQDFINTLMEERKGIKL